MLPHLMPSYGEATTLSGMLSAAQSLYVIFSFYRYIKWRKLLPILAAFLIVSFFAVQYVSAATDTHLKHLLGVVLIIASVYFLIISERIKLNPTLPVQISMGALSGEMGGLFGMHGPPAVIYFLASEQDDKNRYMAICQAYFLLTNIIMTFFRAQNDFLTHFVWESMLYACIGVVLGSMLGKWVFDKIPVETLRKIIYAYMIFSGVLAICY